MGQGSPAEKPERPRKARRVGAKKPKGSHSCPMCNTQLKQRQKFCSEACKAKAFRERKKKKQATA